jgi:hypothetical protein
MFIHQRRVNDSNSRKGKERAKTIQKGLYDEGGFSNLTIDGLANAITIWPSTVSPSIIFHPLPTTRIGSNVPHQDHLATTTSSQKMNVLPIPD